MSKRKHTEEEIKYLKKFYCYMSDRFEHENNIWEYVQELFDEYVDWDKTVFVDKDKKSPPGVMDAIKAIEEKAKVKPPDSPEDYERFITEMNTIDKKHGFN